MKIDIKFTESISKKKHKHKKMNGVIMHFTVLISNSFIKI